MSMAPAANVRQEATDLSASRSVGSRDAQKLSEEKRGCWNFRWMMLMVSPLLALILGPSYLDFALEHQATDRKH
jgi:hypothetical protein